MLISTYLLLIWKFLEEGAVDYNEIFKKSHYLLNKNRMGIYIHNLTGWFLGERWPRKNKKFANPDHQKNRLPLLPVQIPTLYGKTLKSLMLMFRLWETTEEMEMLKAFRQLVEILRSKEQW